MSGEYEADRGASAQRRRRQFLSGALLGAAASAATASSLSAAQAASSKARREGIRPEGAPSDDAGYTPGVLATGERLLFISGQGPENVHADMETQIRQTFDRIGRILKAAGGGFENIVILRSYWVHLGRDLPLYRKVRREYLVEPYPASTAVGTTELAIPGLDLEIEAVAVL